MFNVCQTPCDINYGTDPSDATRICQECYQYNYYNQFGICQSACNVNWITSPPINICVECKYQFGVCKWICDPGYIHNVLVLDWNCELCFDVVSNYKNSIGLMLMEYVIQVAHQECSQII